MKSQLPTFFLLLAFSDLYNKVLEEQEVACKINFIIIVLLLSDVERNDQMQIAAILMLREWRDEVEIQEHIAGVLK